MPGILVQLGHIQRTLKLAPKTNRKWSPTWRLRRNQAICGLGARRTLRKLNFMRVPHAQHTPKGNLQLKLQPMDLNLLLQGQQLTRLLTFAQP